MKFIAIIAGAFFCLTHPAPASEDIKRDKLTIGIGKRLYFLGQRKAEPDEVTIDYKKSVNADIKADGLNPATYQYMMENHFSCITFEHIGFAPYPCPELMLGWGYKSISSGAYSIENWQKAAESSPRLQAQLFRILQPAGQLIFKTCVIAEKQDLNAMNLWSNEGTAIGLQTWESLYRQAGFDNIRFELMYHEDLKGWYVQMSAEKHESLKRQKTELLDF